MALNTARILRKISVVALLVTTWAWGADTTPPARVLILWGPGGHETAAQAIRANILKASPNTEVVFKNIIELLPPHKATMYGDFYAWMNRNVPELFLTYAAEPGLVSARKTKSVSARMMSKMTSSPDRLLQYIQKTKPTSIVTTHFFIAETLAQLREKNLLTKIPVGFLHTDLVSETFYAQLSAALDMTFSPDSDITESWKARGIPADRVMTTGIPVNLSHTRQFSPADVEKFRIDLKLPATRRTIVVMGGSFGLVDYKRVVEEVAAKFSEPIQIVALTGRNRVQKGKLDRLASGVTVMRNGDRLPANVQIRALGTISPEEVSQYLAASDMIVSKPGGLTTFELMYREKPVVYINPGRGVEGFNAQYIERAGAGIVVNGPAEAAAALRQIEDFPEKSATMVAAQRKFRSEFRPDAITQWALDPPPVHQPMILGNPVSTVGDTVTTHYISHFCSDMRAVLNRLFTH